LSGDYGGGRLSGYVSHGDGDCSLEKKSENSFPFSTA